MFLTCVAAILVEVKAVYEGEVWLAMVLNTVGGVTLLDLIFFIGPLRLIRGAVKWYWARRRANIVKRGGESIEEMSERGENLRICRTASVWKSNTTMYTLRCQSNGRRGVRQARYRNQDPLCQKVPFLASCSSHSKEAHQRGAEAGREGLG